MYQLITGLTILFAIYLQPNNAQTNILNVSSNNYNITDYLLELPNNLRTPAQKALRAELLRLQQTQDKWDENNIACTTNTPNETVLTCPPSKYKQPSGECNNVRHRKWGTRGSPFIRLIKPQYSDGISQPRGYGDSPSALPSALDVVRVFANPRTDHMYVTTLLGLWGELLMRDLVQTFHSHRATCCKMPNVPDHHECYGKIDPKICIHYTRSVPSLDEDSCQFKYREQMNLATSFLDGSDLYGLTDDALRSIRVYDSGLVNITACARCNRNALYYLLLKEHNRLAISLAQLNPHWNDRTLFYEARRILTAEIQHITFNEFLTTAIGEIAMAKAELRPLNRGYFKDYSSSHRAGIFNSVAVTALPIFLSMIPESLMNKTVNRDNMHEMIEALTRTEALTPGLRVTAQNEYIGPILIHMARDHGIPSYVNYLRMCSPYQQGVENIDFQNLTNIGFSHDDIKKLKSLYNDIQDVDLLPAALLEYPAPGAVLGHTLSCLLQKQFSLIRHADRFWYENDLPPSSFTLDQLNEIRKVTLAGIICNNVDGLDKMQPMAFVKEDPYLNARINCNQHPSLNMTAWLEMDHIAEITEEMLMQAVTKAEKDIAERRRMEYESWARFGSVDPKSAAGTAASFSKPNKAALKLANSSLLFEFASNEIINSLQNLRRRKRQLFGNSVITAAATTFDFTEGLQSVDVSPFLPSTSALVTLEPHCDDSQTPCDAMSRYRTYTGQCNNLRNPSLGKTLTTFARLLPPVYEDGISKPRKTGVTGASLPSPRVVSALIHPDISNLHTRYTLMTMQYAQFLDHDLTMTPIHKGFHESIPDCRPCDSPRTIHPECDPIPIPQRDHYYPEINVTNGERMCFPFMRSLPGQQHLGSREQVNQNTAFLDASQIYGENLCVIHDLKGFGGRMNSTIHPIKGKELLPQSATHPECKSKSGFCFIAGDGRASEQPGLTTIHTIFMREHNRIVEGLRGVNPHWDAEKLFEEARRIVIAINQHITYNEFLPRLLSWNAVNLYGLKLLPQGYYKEYNPSCNPSILNEFATAAYRIGHSLLRPHIPRMSPNYQVVDPPILLRDGFFKTDMLLQPHMIDEIARGLVSTPMESLDQFVTGEVTNHLFEDRRIPFSGVDLVSLNIQRGRDHGLPSYNNYRALCNLKRATSFEDLSREIPVEVISRLKRIYATVDDIDLFPGGLSERPLQGGLVGPTFACIIAIQFRQLRKCDRHWYENEHPAVRFTEAQLAEIRKITLAKVICENLDAIGDMQRAAFDLPASYPNPRVPCQAHPGIDLSAWRESSGLTGCFIADRHVAIGESAFPSPCTSCVCSSEGAQCASLRVTDCSQLLREWSREAVLRDDVCTTQCGFLLRDSAVNMLTAAIRTQRGHPITPDLVPPPRIVKSRHIHTFTTFKFPDLSQFIG